MPIRISVAQRPWGARCLDALATPNAAARTGAKFHLESFRAAVAVYGPPTSSWHIHAESGQQRLFRNVLDHVLRVAQKDASFRELPQRKR